LYLDSRWAPGWPAVVLDWEDFGLPRDSDAAAEAIVASFERARAGEVVEVGCAGGLGRTGTVLACMAVLGGVAPGRAVAWVRANYDERAVETPEQETWPLWFAERRLGAPAQRSP
jgi:protein-tyrosine phosphatase